MDSETKKALQEYAFGDYKQFMQEKMNYFIELKDADLEPHELKGYCHSASFILSTVLSAYQIRAIPYTVSVIFANDELLEALSADIAVGQILEKYPSARDVRLGYRPPPEYMEEDKDYMHTVIYFPDVGENGSVMDVTADQVNKPSNNLDIKPYWVEVDSLLEHPNIIAYDLNAENRAKYGLIIRHPDLQSIFDTVNEEVARILQKDEVKITVDRYTVDDGEYQIEVSDPSYVFEILVKDVPLVSPDNALGFFSLLFKNYLREGETAPSTISMPTTEIGDKPFVPLFQVIDRAIELSEMLTIDVQKIKEQTLELYMELQ